MKTPFLRTLSIFIAITVFTVLTGCQDSTHSKDVGNQEIFAKGKSAPSKYFTGDVWVKSLVDKDSIYTTSAGNVTFAAKARSHWHSHASGQILIVTGGTGYHQIKGEPRQTIKKGDVVKCPPQTTHWHGASEEDSMTHIYIVPNTERGVVDWKDPVTDKQYFSK